MNPRPFLIIAVLLWDLAVILLVGFILVLAFRISP
jgi:hypothetical protein